MRVFRITKPIPVIDAEPGDCLADCPNDGLRIIRNITRQRAAVLSHSQCMYLISDDDPPAASRRPAPAAPPRERSVLPALPYTPSTEWN